MRVKSLFGLIEFLVLSLFTHAAFCQMEFPNVIANPGFELTDSAGKPLDWTFKDMEATKHLLENIQSFTEEKTINGNFEALDSSGFIKGARINKVGNGRYIDTKRIKISNEEANALRKNVKNGEMMADIEESEGQKALKISIEKSMPGKQWSEVFIPVANIKENYEYLVTWKYKIDGDESFEIMPYLQLPGKGWKQIIVNKENGKKEWKQGAFLFKAEKAGVLNMEFQGICEKEGATGTALIRNIRLFRRDARENKSFTCAPVAHSGKYSLLVSDTGEGFSVESTPDLPIDSSKRYKLSAWVKGENLTGTNCLQIVFLRQWDKNKSPGEITGTAKSVPLTGTFDWRKIEISAASPPNTNIAMARIISSNNKGSLYVDDMFLDGFGEQKIELLYSRAGFEANAQKDIIARTDKEFKTPGVLYVYSTKKEEPVLKKKLQYKGKCIWGKHYYSADFSELKKDGQYYFKVDFGNSSTCQSPCFKLSQNLYKELRKFALQWYYYQRCGCEVKGWHGPCHLDDAWITDWKMTKKIKHVNLVGGWHDAGDMNKWTEGQGATVWELARCYETTQDNDKSFLKTELPDFITEMNWGAQFVMKAYAGEGKWYRCCKAGTSGVPTDKETDNIPENTDDRYCNNVNPCPQATMGLTKYASVIAPFSKEESNKALQIAKDAFEYDLVKYSKDNETVFGSFPNPLYGYYTNVVLSAIELWKLTGDEKYRTIAVKMTKKTCDLVSRRIYLEMPSPSRKDAEAQITQITALFATVLEEFIQTFPDNEITPKCKAALNIFLDDLVNSTKNNPLNIITPFFSKNYIYSPARHVPYILYMTKHLAIGARLLSRPELLPLAEKNLQYTWGRNFAGISNMALVGDKYTAQFTHMYANPGHSDGIMPGAVNKGHGFRLRKEVFPFANLPMPHPRYLENGNQEVWLFVQDSFMNACIETEKALEDLKKQETIPVL